MVFQPIDPAHDRIATFQRNFQQLRMLRHGKALGINTSPERASTGGKFKQTGIHS